MVVVVGRMSILQGSVFLFFFFYIILFLFRLICLLFVTSFIIYFLLKKKKKNSMETLKSIKGTKQNKSIKGTSCYICSEALAIVCYGMAMVRTSQTVCRYKFV